MDLYGVRHLVSTKVWKRSAKIMGRVANFRVGTFKLTGLVLSSSKDYLYNPWVAKDGTFYCDCEGFESAETICSHIMALLRKAEFEGFDINPWIKGLRGENIISDDMIYETSLEGYNKLFGGLRGGRHISCLCAEPEIGKSYLSAQFTVDMAIKHNLSSLIVDTEGGIAPEWIELIAKRFDAEIPVKFINWRVRVEGGDNPAPKYDYADFKVKEYASKDPTVYIYDARHIIQVLPFFGRPLSFKIKSGVIEPIEAGGMKPIWDSPIGQLVEACNIGYVANDSLSMPLENFFTGGQINYRTRGKATQVWLGRAQDLIDEYKVVFMNIVHAVVDHTNKWSDPAPVGGKAVLHNNKYIAMLRRYQNKKAAKAQNVNWRNLRRLQIFRHMTKAPFSEETFCMTTDAGIIDFDPKGMEEEE